MQNFTLLNGVKIPAVAYGTWRMPGSQACVDAVLCALQNGYRHIDTAAKYENEESVGQALRQSGLARKEVFLTSKLWNTEHSYEKCIAAFEATLQRLGTDYLDLYLIHWPRPAAYRDNWQEANAQAWRAMEDLYRQGRIRAIGVSNFMPHHLDALLQTAQVMPMVNQIELHPGCRQQEAVAYCKEKGIQLEAWAPFAVGKALTVPTVTEIAQQVAKTPAQVVLRWLFQQDIVTLPKSATPERIASNLQLWDFELSKQQMTRLNAVRKQSLARRHDPDNIDF